MLHLWLSWFWYVQMCYILWFASLLQKYICSDYSNDWLVFNFHEIRSWVQFQQDMLIWSMLHLILSAFALVSNQTLWPHKFNTPNSLFLLNFLSCIFCTIYVRQLASLNRAIFLLCFSVLCFFPYLSLNMLVKLCMPRLCSAFVFFFQYFPGIEWESCSCYA